MTTTEDPDDTQSADEALQHAELVRSAHALRDTLHKTMRETVHERRRSLFWMVCLGVGNAMTGYGAWLHWQDSASDWPLVLAIACLVVVVRVARWLADYAHSWFLIARALSVTEGVISGRIRPERGPRE